MQAYLVSLFGRYYRIPGMISYTQETFLLPQNIVVQTMYSKPAYLGKRFTDQGNKGSNVSCKSLAKPCPIRMIPDLAFPIIISGVHWAGLSLVDLPLLLFL